jgi:hypothetical protein
MHNINFITAELMPLSYQCFFGGGERQALAFSINSTVHFLVSSFSQTVWFFEDKQ